MRKLLDRLQADFLKKMAALKNKCIRLVSNTATIMKHNWEYKKLGEVCESINGLWTGKNPPFVNIGVICNTNFTKSCTLDTSNIFYTNVEKKAFNKRKLKLGDIIVEKSGGSEKQPVGRPVLFNLGGPFSFSNFTATLRLTDPNISSAFLHKVLSSFYFFGRTRKMQKRTTGLFNLNWKLYLNQLIPVPPREEQERIVAELDKINEVIEECRELLRTLDSLAQSIFYDTFDKIKETIELRHFAKALVGGKSLASLELSPNLVLKSGAVSYDYFDKTATKFLPKDYEPLKEHKVKVGDVIISRMNTSDLVGACAYVFDVDDNTFLPDRLWRLELNDNANPIFIWKSLISEEAKIQIKEKASGTSGSMKNISKPLLLSVKIKRAPLELQQQFAAQIEAIEAQKNAVEATISEMKTLLDSRMDYWFND